ncbi:hypothetical protein Bca52824_019599 [Brassica carinata]|uniref:Response regulatory domain-containing protein n=1 Tax=Brassica carinata TaxID=52824 RepID=A0A8X8AZQ1_BRACI|nr:hypothetical protein Bca52824_019599 [Brassica carinata]
MFSGKIPEGLRVLVFDEDPQYLSSLVEHLQEFQYKVTRCNEEEEAIYLLRTHMNKFDIAILEAQNPYGATFRLLSEIGSEMNIIIISKDDSVKSVINWIRNGACDYLIKPIRHEDLRLIFKHAVKKMEVRRSVAVVGEAEDKAAKQSSSYVGDFTMRNANERKRSMFLDGQASKEDQNHYRDSTTKKRRLAWVGNLHTKFVEAVDYFGIDKAVPKKILERMNIENITRDNVASHLQKFRMNLKKQNDQNKKNQSLTTSQRRMYSGEGSSEFHRGMNVQQILNPNLMTQFISPLGHHDDDGVSVSLSERNLVMNHQYHHTHQTSQFGCIDHNNPEESLAYNEEEAGVSKLICSFTQDSEEMSLLHLYEPVMETMMHVHEPSMVDIPSFPSPVTQSSFLNQAKTITMVDVCGQQQINNLIDGNNFLDNPRLGSAKRDQDGSRSGGPA